MTLETAVIRSIEALDWLIRTYPDTEHAEEAYLKKGEVLFRLKKQPAEAIEVLKEGAAKAKYRPGMFSEHLGRIYLVIGEYDQAREYFGRLVKSEVLDLHEAGVFYSGLLLSFSGDYETARDTLTALAESNPSSQFTNDAIRLAWVIEEGLQGTRAASPATAASTSL